MKKNILIKTAAVALAVVITTATALGVSAANNRNISVNLDETVSTGFKGIGSNLWAGSLTAEEKAGLNTNEANFAINEKRISTIQPGPMRMMICPDWIVDFSDGKSGEENWKNGIYDFTTDRIYTLEKYCATFKESGTDVQINFGGVNATSICKWFPIKDTTDISRAAPADLESFALAASSLLQYLWNKGYDNVKYLSFYNEVNGNNFQSFGDEREYWASMVKCVDAQLKADGVRNKVKIIGSESNTTGNLISSSIDWMKYMHDNIGDCYDILSTHMYLSNVDKNETSVYLNNTDSITKNLKSIRAAIGDDELWITEFDWNSSRSDTSFDVSRASQVITFANGGVSSAAFWFFCTTLIPAPFSVSHGGLWAKPDDTDTIGWGYEEMGLIMRYVPKNSRVVAVTEENDDILSCAFVGEDGNITILVEADESGTNRDLEIDFGKNINKTFRRHSMEYPDVITTKLSDGGNAIIPVSERNLTVANKLTDTIGTEHQLIVYTTMPEEEQVVFEGSIKKNVKAGETLQVNIDRVYASENQNVTWSIYNCVNPDGTAIYNDGSSNISAAGSIDQNGLYNASGVAAGTKVAVKATTADGTAYGVVYIVVG